MKKPSGKFSDMINGAIAGVVSTFATLPFQVIRTNMMVNSVTGKGPRLLNVMKKIYLEEGLIGFYRALIPNLIRIPIGASLYFGTLEKIKALLSKYGKFSNTFVNFTASGLAIAVQCTFTNPIVVAATRFEVVGFNSYDNIFDAMKKIKQQEGYKGFTKGLWPLLCKEVPSHALFYVLYEMTKQFLTPFRVLPNNMKVTLSAFLATLVVTVLDNPLDLIRTRTQYLHISQNIDHKYKGIISALFQIWSKEGLQGLTNGFIPRLLRKGVASTVMWTVYEGLSRHQKLKQEKEKISN